MGPKKVLAVILLATTAVASGVLVRQGQPDHPEEQISLAELPPRFETPRETRTGTGFSGKNRTELLARSLAEEIIKQNPNGPELLGDSWTASIISEEALERIIDEQAAQFDPGKLLPVVADGDIAVTKGREARALGRYLDESLVGVHAALQNLALPKKNFSEEDVRKLAAEYGAITERLAALSVPEDLARFHKKELELFLAQKNFFDAVLGYNDDPIGAVLVAQHADFYVEHFERELAELQSELTAFLDGKLSLYPSGDQKSIAERILRIERAHATLPVIDAAAIASIIADMIANVLEWVKDAARWAADKAWILAVEVLKKRLLDMIVDQIIAWIQGGGSPRFISDWEGFLLDAANAGVGDVARQLGLGFLCSPFNLQIQLLLSPIPKFSERVTCTLDSIVGNIENFYTDFRNGGWIAYREAWRPQNNFWGAAITVYDEALREASNRSVASAQEGVANQGFLSTKRCVQEELDFETGEPTGGCSRFEVTTPGRTVGDALARAVGADIDYIVNAEDLSAYVAAIADAAINRLVAAGVDGIRGVLTPSAPSGGFVPPGVTGPCAGLAGAALQACIASREALGNVGSEAKRPMLDLIDRILPEKQGTLNEKQASLAIISGPSTGIIDLLAALQSCNPSDPTLQQFSAASFQTIAQGLQSQIPPLQAQVTTLSTLRANILGVPNNRPDLLGPLTTQLQQYIDQNGGDWTVAQQERTSATAERSQLQSQQTQIQIALNACQAQGGQQQQ